MALNARQASNRAFARTRKGKADVLLIVVLGVLIAIGLVLVLFTIIRQSEEHVEQVHRTKVNYENMLEWRPSRKNCEERVLKQVRESPEREKADFGCMDLTEKSVAAIGSLKKLRVLSLGDSTFGNEWLRYLDGLPLTDLNLGGTRLNDRGLAIVATFGRLERLNLEGTDISDEGMRVLGQLRRLRTLRLIACKITDAGVEQVSSMSSLTNLDLSECPVTAASTGSVVRLSKLTSLSLGGTAMKADDIARLAVLRNLRSLNLARCSLDDPAVVTALRLGRLVSLDLSGNDFTDCGLSVQDGPIALTSLKLKDCPNVTEAGVQRFEKEHPTIDVSYARIERISDSVTFKDLKKAVVKLQMQEFKKADDK